MFCTKCGKVNPNDSRFCMKCGYQFQEAATNESVPIPLKNQLNLYKKKKQIMNTVILIIFGIIGITCSIIFSHKVSETSTYSLGINLDELKIRFNEFSDKLKTLNEFYIGNNFEVKEGEKVNTYRYLFGNYCYIRGEINKSDNSVRTIYAVIPEIAKISSQLTIIQLAGISIKVSDDNIQPNEIDQILKNLNLEDPNYDGDYKETTFNNKTYACGFKTGLGFVFLIRETNDNEILNNDNL